MLFYPGLHKPGHARHFERAFISARVMRERAGKPMQARAWIMDSGAFKELELFGRYQFELEEYAALIRKWQHDGELVAAVAQDFMCEDHILARTTDIVNAALGTGPHTRERIIHIHQTWTIERYCRLRSLAPSGVHVMPVLQGFTAAQYVAHVRQYGTDLQAAHYVGVGSVCKRQGSPAVIAGILRAIHAERADLRLHGFGVKLTSLRDANVRDRLHSADSMAWSLSARMNGRNRNDWREAMAFAERIERMHVQTEMDV